MAVSLVAMATATLFLFVGVVFERIEEQNWFIYLSGSLACFRMDKRKARIRNDDVITLMTTQRGNVT